MRRQQQEERDAPLEGIREVDSESTADERRTRLSPSIIRRTFMRASPKMEGGGGKVKSPTGYFNKQLFSPRSKNKAKSSTTLNVRRFSSDGIFSSPHQIDRSTAVGRRLSKDVSFLTSSPPDINSRRSSYLDIINSGSKLSGKSPVLSIENVSDCSSARSGDYPRKLSDSESIGKKLATLPKYKEPLERNRLQPQYSLTLGKSDETLSKPRQENTQVSSAKSCQSITDSEPSPANSGFINLTSEQKSNLSDDEIARRNKMTIEQLQSHLSKKGANPGGKDSNVKLVSTNPQITIQIEDTSKPPVARKPKIRHQSLGEPIKSAPEPMKRSKLTEHSRSLDSNPPKARTSHYHPLPPAPPPPNCSPRNSNGRSPLERLSKDELVLLWRSSESELRSHLLKAIRDKEEVVDPT